MVKKSTYVLLAILVVLLLLLIADPSQGMETVYLCTKMTRKSSNGERITTATYDTNGNILFIESSENGVSYISRRFTYDNQNNLLSETKYSYKGEVVSQSTYAYQQYQTVVTYYIPPEYVSFTSPRSNYTVIYTYDAFGNQLSLRYINHNNVAFYENFQTYDLFGNLLTNITYQEGSLLGNYRYTYDAQGNRIRYAGYDDGGEETFRYEYFYDDNGNKIGEKYYTENVLISETKNTLDERGNIIEEFVENIKKRETYTTTFTYDSQNRLLSKEFFNNGYINRKTYKYDFAGNLIYRYRFETSYKPLASSTEYQYIAIRVPAERAKKIREMQTELFGNQPE